MLNLGFAAGAAVGVVVLAGVSAGGFLLFRKVRQDEEDRIRRVQDLDNE